MTACDGVAQDEEGGLASRRESAHVHAVGRAAGAAMPALRKDDGATRDAPYTPGTGPGRWRPHPNPDPPHPPIANKDLAPDYVPSASTGWGNVTPFTLLSAAQFWLPGPPALTSEADALDYNEVKRLGGQVSEERTAEQAEIARFWFEGPQAWSRIARVVAEAWGLDAWDSARRPGGGCQGSAATCTSPVVAVGSRGCAA